MRYYIEEHYRLDGQRKHVQALFNAFPLWAGTNPIAESVEDLDMAVTLGDEIHHVEFTSSTEVTEHTNDITFDLPFNQMAFGCGRAAQDMHAIIQAFMSLHDEDRWKILSGHTTVTSTCDEEDIENASLALTIHHTGRDLSMLRREPDPLEWFPHYSQ